MLKRKANLYAVVLIVLTACSKQNTTPISQSIATDSSSSNFTWRWPFRGLGQDTGTAQTVFGLIDEQGVGMSTQDGITQTRTDMSTAGVKLTRISIALSETTVNKTIDDYLSNGYNVNILANWNNGVNGTRGFATSSEMDNVQAKAEEFFSYYAPYKDQIPFVAVENEWDWEVQHGANVQDYLTELSIITDVGHKYGFKIADGGITATSLQRWTYSQLPPDEQQQWNQDYWVGANGGGFDYNTLMDIINTYIAGAKNIDFDYSNVHWCNVSTCSDGFGTATQEFMQACNKQAVTCNEFYIKTVSQDLFDSTVNEIKGNAEYAIAYSGSDNDGKAINLTDGMLTSL